MIDNKERKLKVHERSSINSYQILLYGNQTQDKIKFFGKTRDGVAIKLNNQPEMTIQIKKQIEHLFLYAVEGNVFYDMKNKNLSKLIISYLSKIIYIYNYLIIHC